ncbi:DnaB-like helicase N-terminal domain-containing protein [Actinomadura hibisca]|uniref:DnaB-like helicase N-terminal domain-containing protein n=1 Tax=Actinomadura hibisca TaxID=68565 RepID=UPI0008344730|nr:DnaB-like helicase N-terminal domain-containing protein [Actinomadura hibisca]
MKVWAHTVEEGILGALIYDPDRLEDIPLPVRERLLSDEGILVPDHVAILGALVQARAVDPELRGTDLVNAIVAAVDDPAVRAERLLGMAFHYTEPIFLARDADDLIAFAQARNGGPLPERISHFRALSDPNGQDGPTRIQEFVLTALIKDPELAREVAEWLPAEAFTTPNRRDIYQAILAADQLAELPAGGFGPTLVEDVNVARDALAERVAADPAWELPSTGLNLNSFDLNEDGYIRYLAHASMGKFNGVEFARVMLEELTMTEPPMVLPAPVRALYPSLYPGPYTPDLRYEGPPPIQAERTQELGASHVAHQHAQQAPADRPITLEAPR